MGSITIVISIASHFFSNSDENRELVQASAITGVLPDFPRCLIQRIVKLCCMGLNHFPIPGHLLQYIIKYISYISVNRTTSIEKDTFTCVIINYAVVAKKGNVSLISPQSQQNIYIYIYIYMYVYINSLLWGLSR